VATVTQGGIVDLGAALRERIAGLSRVEFEHCILRVIIGAVVMAYLLWAFATRHSSWTETDKVFISFLGTWFVFSVGLLCATWVWPSPSTSRRVLGVIGDILVTTVALYFMGSSGFVLVGLYLFVIFGNGFRYGRGYVHLTQILSVAGLIAVGLTDWWWRFQPSVLAGSLALLIVIPLYVFALLDRMKIERTRLEAALKECIKKQAPAS
jgi:two-component system sensor histidine kinase RpfC